MLYCLDSFKVSKRGPKKCNFCYKSLCFYCLENSKLRNIRIQSKKTGWIQLSAVCLLGILLVGIPLRCFKSVFVIRINGLLNAHKTTIIADFLHQL